MLLDVVQSTYFFTLNKVFQLSIQILIVFQSLLLDHSCIIFINQILAERLVLTFTFLSPLIQHLVLLSLVVHKGCTFKSEAFRLLAMLIPRLKVLLQALLTLSHK